MSDDKLPRLYRCDKVFVPSVGEVKSKEVTVVAEDSEKAKKLFDEIWSKNE